MLDLRLAVVDSGGGKNPMLAFVDEEGEVVTRIGPIPKRANLVRQWLAEAYRCMGLVDVQTITGDGSGTALPPIVEGPQEASDAPSVAR